MRKVLPFIKSEYFTDESERTVYKIISEFVVKYNKPPTTEALGITLQNSSLPEGTFKETSELVKELDIFEKPNQDWLLDETEKFCKDKAVYNAILQSIGIMEGRDKNFSKDGIPSLLQEALGVCFDSSVGHDYFEDSSIVLIFIIGWSLAFRLIYRYSIKSQMEAYRTRRLILLWLVLVWVSLFSCVTWLLRIWL
jgi:hypothetical protein